MLQSNSKPLTAAVVFRPCNEMEDESDWHCAKGYCQCNTTSVIPPVRKAMSVKRRCLQRLSQNTPHWQILRKELHPPEGKLVDFNLFSWVWHYQLPQLMEQTISAGSSVQWRMCLRTCRSAHSRIRGFWRASLTQRCLLQWLLPAASLHKMLWNRNLWGLGKWDIWIAGRWWASHAR